MILDKEVHWGKKNEPRSLPYITPPKKNQFEMNHEMYHKNQKYKVLEENVGE